MLIVPDPATLENPAVGSYRSSHRTKLGVKGVWCCQRCSCGGFLSGFLRGLRAVGLDAGEEGGGGFVFLVLGDEVAGEGFFQDGLAQGVGAGEGGVDLGLERVGGLEPGVEAADDFGLFGRGADWDL